MQAWFTIYLLFVLNDREGVRLSRAAMHALSLQPLPLPLPFPNFGRNHQSLAEVIVKHQTLFSVQTGSDFLEQPITLERTFFGFVRLLFLDPFEEFQTRFLHRGWNAFFARRIMRTDFEDMEGPLHYLGQILDHPVASAHSSTERLKELAFTYPFPNIHSPGFMDGRGAGFLSNLVGPPTGRFSHNDSQRGSYERSNRAQNEASIPISISRYPQSNTYPVRYTDPRPSRFANPHGIVSSPPRSLPLAMIPMTRSRRRDQQVLAQTGFGPSAFRSAPPPRLVVPDVENESLTSPHRAPSHPYRSLHRRSRQRRPIPESMMMEFEPLPVNRNSDTQTLEDGHMPSEAVRPQSMQGSQSSFLSMRASPSPVADDESMIVLRVGRDGQSARILVDSHDAARRGRRVPSLQHDLGGIMDPDECTICKGSWSWIKGNTNGAPQSSPADWRLVILPCRHTYHEECLARWFLISIHVIYSFD